MKRTVRLGTRLVALFMLLALLMTVTFTAGMQSVLRGGWQDYARPLVADYTDMLVAEIGTPPSIEKARALTERLPLRISIDGPVVNWSSHPGRGDGRRRAFANNDASDGGWRPVRLLADGHRIHFGLADVEREHRPRTFGWWTLAALLLLTAGAYLYVRRLLRPLHDIRAGVQRYGRGDFAQPIAPPGAAARDELGELATQIDTMAGELQHMLEAKRQLLLAISHELRSPLTRARLNAELVDDGAPRAALLRDLALMRDLITDLLEGERLAAGHAAIHPEPSDLNALVQEVIDGPFAGRGIALELAANLPPLPLDRSRIRLLLRNLLDNALRHSPAGAAPPRLGTVLAGGEVVLSVRDHGPGVDDAQLPHLTEAFYRADAARQRATGGVGLGLHLCQRVAQAHGGTLSVANARPGLCVEVRLPARA